MREGEIEIDGDIEFGPQCVKPVRLQYLNEIEQVRKEYPEDKIEDLACSVDFSVDADTPRFDLYNPPLCACLTPEEATTYLLEHASFYGTVPPSLDALTMDDEGNYVILIAGHRRKRAVELLADRYNLDPERAVIRSNLREHISFEDSLVAQVRENTYEKVTPEELAKNIQQYYAYLKKQNPTEPPTYGEISAKIGQSVNIVRDATKFMRLPEEIRNYVKTQRDLVPYSTLVDLEPLMRKLEEYYQYRGYKGDEGRFVTDYLHGVVRNIMDNKLDSQTKTVDARLIIKARIEALSIETDFHQDSFFNEDELASMRASKARITKRLVRSAIGALRLATSEGCQLSAEDYTTLQRVLSRQTEPGVNHSQPQEEALDL